MPLRTGPLPLWLRALHWAVIVNFALQVLYGCRMVFWVFAPGGVGGPLGAAARDVPFELMVTRRLYAIETWVAIGGLAVYLAVTEVLPRRLSRPPAGPDAPRGSGAPRP